MLCRHSAAKFCSRFELTDQRFKLVNGNVKKLFAEVYLVHALGVQAVVNGRLQRGCILGEYERNADLENTVTERAKITDYINVASLSILELCYHIFLFGHGRLLCFKLGNFGRQLLQLLSLGVLNLGAEFADLGGVLCFLRLDLLLLGFQSAAFVFSCPCCSLVVRFQFDIVIMYGEEFFLVLEFLFKKLDLH